MNLLSSILRHASRICRLRSTACAIALIGLSSGSAAAASAPVYKCFDRQLAVVYTDMPCKDGELMDLRAGDADPAAVARLERERDALERSSAQRITDLRRAALTRQQYAALPEYAPGYETAGYGDVAEYFPYGYGVLAYAPARHRTPDARFDRRGARHGAPPRTPPPLRR